jgi:hypothetical protein
MRGPHPPAPDRDWTIINPGDTQLLESFDRSDDVDQRIHRANLMQGDLISRQPVDAAFRLAQQPKGAHRARAHPRR